MPSTATVDPPAPSLASRVSRVVVLACIVGAALAGVATGVVSEELFLASEDRQLQETAMLAMRETSSERTSPETLRHVVDRENEERSTVGERVALFIGGRFAGGAHELSGEGEGCRTTASSSGETRVCLVRAGDRTVVAGAPMQGEVERRLALAQGALIAAVAATLLGVLASGALARWSAGPLSRLRDELEVAGPAALSNARAASSGCVEVDSLRHTFAALVTKLDDEATATRRFAGQAAHELRTPLTALGAELDLLAESEENVREPVARARQTVDHLARVVEHLLLLAEAGSGNLQIAHEAVALEDIVRDAMATRFMSDAARVSVELGAPGTVHGDPVLLRTLIDNVIDNALRHTHGARVSVGVQEAADRVLVRIDDEGPGVAPRVLEPHARAPRAGHGLGLAIVACIVHAHGGHAEFTTRAPGERGARLEVSFPSWSPDARALAES